MNVLPMQKKVQVWNLSFSETSLLALNNPFFPLHSPTISQNQLVFHKSLSTNMLHREAILRIPHRVTEEHAVP